MAQAQTGAHGIYVGLSGSYRQRADAIVSPSHYSGLTWGPALHLDLSTSTQLRRVDLDVAFPRLTSAHTGGGAHVQKGSQTSLGLVWFQRIIGLGEGGFGLRMGGEFRVDAALFDHWYTRESEENWMDLFGVLSPGLGWSWRFSSGDELSQEVTVPLAGFTMRPLYQGMTRRPRPRFANPGEVEGLHLGLRFLRHPGKGIRWGAKYEYQALRHRVPRLLVRTRHSFTLFVAAWELNR